MRFGINLPRIYLQNDGSGGGAIGGTGSSGGNGFGGGNHDNGGRQNPADVVARYNGDAVRLASDLSASEARNYDLREKNRDLRHEVETLKKQVPGEGAIVLDKEQAAQWNAIQKLGLKPEEIEAQLTAGKTAQETVARHLREGVKGVLDESAEIEHWKPGVLKLLAENLNVQLRDQEILDGEGKKKVEKRPFVITLENGQEKAVALREHFKAKGDDVLESLAAEGTGEGYYNVQTPAPGSNGHANGHANGTTYPPQGGGSPAKPGTYQPRNRYQHNLPQNEAAK